MQQPRHKSCIHEGAALINIDGVDKMFEIALSVKQYNLSPQTTALNMNIVE